MHGIWALGNTLYWLYDSAQETEQRPAKVPSGNGNHITKSFILNWNSLLVAPILPSHHLPQSLLEFLFFFAAAVPGVAPADVRFSTVTSRLVVFVFPPIPFLEFNAHLSRYEAKIEGSGYHIPFATFSSDSDNILNNLRPFTTYNVSTRACNIIGCGPASNSFQVTTLPEG